MIRRAASLGLLLLLGCATVPPPEPEEWDRELPEGWQIDDLAEEGEDGEEGDLAFVAIRVLDGATGEPIHGARIDNWWEADTPHAEPWEDLLEGTWTTDRDGWALLPSRDHAPWYFVEAPGCAAFAEMALLEDFLLVRGRDFVVEVRDWRDRPVPGAMVDLLLGCGHTPNARCGTTGPDGRVVIPCADDFRSTLWIRAPGVAGRSDGYGNWDDLPEENGVRILRGEPGPMLEGVVLRADGSPAAGARVGTFDSHRGPWTVAGPDGRYRLVGAEPRAGLVAMSPASDPVPEGFQFPQTEFLSFPGVFATVRLPAEGKRWPTPEERDAEREKARAERDAFERGEEGEPEVPAEGPGICVRVEAVPGVTPFGRVGIHFVRDGDGAARETSPMFRAGAAVRAVGAGPGAWTVTAGDPAGLLRPESKRIEVREGWTEVSFTLVPNPAWRPRVLERSSDGTMGDLPNLRSGAIFVTSEHGVVEATPRMAEDGSFDGSIHVPASGPFAVEFRAADGRRARVLLDGPPSSEGPALVLPSPLEEAESDETRRDSTKSRLRVLLPDGSPADDAWAEILSVLPPDPRFPGFRRGDEDSVHLGERGEAECSLQPGDRLTVMHRTDDGILPFSERIRGPGPWVLRWPAGEVVIRAADETGAPLTEFSALLRGWDSIESEDGAVRLRGVSQGPLRLWVAAPGRRVHDLRLVLAEAERREITVRMR